MSFRELLANCYLLVIIVTWHVIYLLYSSSAGNVLGVCLRFMGLMSCAFFCFWRIVSGDTGRLVYIYDWWGYQSNASLKAIRDPLLLFYFCVCFQISIGNLDCFVWSWICFYLCGCWVLGSRTPWIEGVMLWTFHLLSYCHFISKKKTISPSIIRSGEGLFLRCVFWLFDYAFINFGWSFCFGVGLGHLGFRLESLDRWVPFLLPLLINLSCLNSTVPVGTRPRWSHWNSLFFYLFVDLPCALLP